MMTKNLEAIKISMFSEALRQEFREGRAKEGLNVQKTGSKEGMGVIS